MGLRETLGAATPGPWEARDATTIDSRDGREEWWNLYASGYRLGGVEFGRDARLIALAPELAALALDMGDLLRGLYYRPAGTNALLARLDQIGKEQT